MNPWQRDELDDRGLAATLGELAGDFPTDQTAVFADVVRRGQRARRRRAAAMSTAALVLVSLVGVAYAAGVRDGSRTIEPAGSGDRYDDRDDASLPSIVDGSVTTVDDSNPDDSAVDTVVTSEVSSPDSSPASVSSVPISTPSSTPSSTNPPSTNPPSTNPPPTNPPPTTVPSTTSPPGPVTETFTCPGGWATVRLASGSLTLLDWEPAEGFEDEVEESSGDRVEIRFEADDVESRLRVDLVAGSMVLRCDE